MSMRALALGLLAALAGCFPLGGSQECTVDSDCGPDLACTRTHECASGTLVDAVVHWTLDGAAAGDSACSADGVDHMSISFTDTATGEGLTYSPVPCKLGQATYDKMPPRFDQVGINAHAADDTVLDGAVADLQPGVNQIEFDLSP
jgi:hypothetical protein